MRRERFLRTLAWLPVALPVLALPAVRIDGVVGSFARHLCLSLYAFPSYALVAAVFLGRLRGRPARSYWTTAVFAPGIFLVAWYAIAVIGWVLMAGLFAATMFFFWLLEVRGVGAQAFPGLIAYRLTPWARVGGMAFLAAATLLLGAVWAHVSDLGVSATAVSLSFVALLAWAGTGLMLVVFAAHVSRAQAAEPRHRAIQLVELLIWIGFLCGQSVVSRWHP